MNMDIFSLKSYIEKMTKKQQIEILKILKQGDEKLNENKSGIFVNLSNIQEETMQNIFSYVQYLLNQENNLSLMENQKDDYKNEFFSDVN